MQLQNKVAVVTGAAKRVGRAIALALARRGAHIIVHYRSSSNEAASVAREIRALGVEALPVKADLSSARQAEGVIKTAARKFGHVDILVNSASIYEKTPLGQVTEQEWDRHLDVNLKSIFFMSQAAADIMQRQKTGKIVNIIDSDTRNPYAGYTPYLVSKAGLEGLTRCLALELAPKIQVNGVSPGPVALPPGWGEKMRRAIIKATPLRRIGTPQDIANAVLFCVESADFMTGAIIPVDGGQHLT